MIEIIGFTCCRFEIPWSSGAVANSQLIVVSVLGCKLHALVVRHAVPCVARIPVECDIDQHMMAYGIYSPI